MNEILKAIAERYSCRDFLDTPLTDEQLKAITEAALAAPSAVNRQPWRIIIITDKAIIDEMNDEGISILAAAEDKSLYERMMSRGGKMLYNAPFLALILSDDSPWAKVDCGILCQTIALAAQSLGLGSCIVGMARTPLDGPRGDEFKKRLKFPEGYDFCIGILVGTPNSGKEPHELEMDKVTFV